MNNLLPVKTISKTSKKLIIGIIIGLVVLIISVGVVVQLGNGSAQKMATNPQKQAEYLAKIKNEYQANFRQIISGYLAAAIGSGDLLNLTGQIKEKILALRVPVDCKDNHLQTVLLLSGIEEKIKSQSIGDLQENLAGLQNILAKF